MFGSSRTSEQTMTTTAAPTLSETDVAAIEEIIAKSADIIRSQDWDGFIAMFTDDILLMPPGAPTVVGRAAAREFFDAFPTIKAFSSNMEAVEGRGDFGVVRGSYTMTIETDDGAMDDTGKWMLTMQRGDDDTWLVVWDTWNSDQAPA